MNLKIFSNIEQRCDMFGKVSFFVVIPALHSQSCPAKVWKEIWPNCNEFESFE